MNSRLLLFTFFVNVEVNCYGIKIIEQRKRSSAVIVKEYCLVIGEERKFAKNIRETKSKRFRGEKRRRISKTIIKRFLTAFGVIWNKDGKTVGMLEMTLREYSERQNNVIERQSLEESKRENQVMQR